MNCPELKKKGIEHCRTCCSVEELMVISTSTLKSGRKSVRHMCRACNTDRHKKYRATEKGMKNVREAVYRSIEKYKEKQKAREVLNYAVKSGKVEKATNCEVCKEEKRLHGHHDDYSKPLEVRWVCRSCHADIHKR